MLSKLFHASARAAPRWGVRSPCHCPCTAPWRIDSGSGYRQSEGTHLSARHNNSRSSVVNSPLTVWVGRGLCLNGRHAAVRRTRGRRHTVRHRPGAPLGPFTAPRRPSPPPRSHDAAARRGVNRVALQVWHGVSWRRLGDGICHRGVQIRSLRRRHPTSRQYSAWWTRRQGGARQDECAGRSGRCQPSYACELKLYRITARDCACASSSVAPRRERWDGRGRRAPVCGGG
jgi:hypothetical protein